MWLDVKLSCEIGSYIVIYCAVHRYYYPIFYLGEVYDIYVDAMLLAIKHTRISIPENFQFLGGRRNNLKK